MASSIIVDLESPDLDVELISLVRAHPMLYEKDLRSRPYDSMKLKMELWKSIGMSLGLESRYCIMRWKSLRERYRREHLKSKELGEKAIVVWPLYEKMRFLNNELKYYGLNQTKGPMLQKVTTTTWNVMDAEQQIEDVIANVEDDALQEAMDESTLSMEKVADMVVTTSSAISTSSIAAQHDAHSSNGEQLNASTMRRIDVLLEGLGVENRIKAEKHIVAYLCKCQLKSLNNESVDDVTI